MDLLPWSLVLLSGLIHALWNLKVKKVNNRVQYLAVAYTAAGAVLFPAVLVSGGPGIPMKACLPVVLSALAEVMYVVSLSKAYAVSNLTFVYPIARGSALIWAAAAGHLFFGENLSGTGIIAIFTIIAGILAAGLEKEGGTVRALFLTLGAGLFIGCYTSLDRKAIEYISVQSLLFWKFILSGIILLALTVRSGSLAEDLKKDIKTAVPTGIFILMAYSLVVVAMNYSNLGYVAAGRESGIAHATLFGWLFLHERPGMRRLAGIIAIFSGIILLKLA